MSEYTLEQLGGDEYKKLKKEQAERKNCFIGDDIVKMDIAIEIMAEMIARRSLRQMDEKDPNVISKLEEELNILAHERDLMYQGDRKTIEKILTVYSDEIRKYYKE